MGTHIFENLSLQTHIENKGDFCYFDPDETGGIDPIIGWVELSKLQKKRHLAVFSRFQQPPNQSRACFICVQVEN